MSYLSICVSQCVYARARARARVRGREIIADEMYYFMISQSLNGDLSCIEARASNKYDYYYYGANTARMIIDV